MSIFFSKYDRLITFVEVQVSLFSSTRSNCYGCNTFYQAWLPELRKRSKRIAAINAIRRN